MTKIDKKLADNITKTWEMTEELSNRVFKLIDADIEKEHKQREFLLRFYRQFKQYAAKENEKKRIQEANLKAFMQKLKDKNLNLMVLCPEGYKDLQKCLIFTEDEKKEPASFLEELEKFFSKLLGDKND